MLKRYKLSNKILFINLNFMEEVKGVPDRYLIIAGAKCVRERFKVDIKNLAKKIHLAKLEKVAEANGIDVKQWYRDATCQAIDQLIQDGTIKLWYLSRHYCRLFK